MLIRNNSKSKTRSSSAGVVGKSNQARFTDSPSWSPAFMELRYRHKYFEFSRVARARQDSMERLSGETLRQIFTVKTFFPPRLSQQEASRKLSKTHIETMPICQREHLGKPCRNKWQRKLTGRSQPQSPHQTNSAHAWTNLLNYHYTAESIKGFSMRINTKLSFPVSQ